MKTKFTLFSFVFALCVSTVNAQVNKQDSLALVDLYNSTNGPNWYNQENWLTKNPVSTWYGITVTNKRVTNIYMNGNNLNGSISYSIGNLVKLTDLELSSNQLSGSIPSSIGNLVNLSGINLVFNGLSGSIPSSIGNLVNVHNLYLSENRLSGSIPFSIGNLVNLTDLDLSGNQLSSIPSSIGKLVNLSSLSISSNQLGGTIPSAIGNLKNLSVLDLSSNKFIGGIPSWISNLLNLHRLSLYENQLAGNIPSSIGQLTKLTSLSLGGSKLTGSIPSSIGNLVNLFTLFIVDSKLSGSIPSSIGNLTNLYEVYLYNNQLSGHIPASIGNLKNLHILLLGTNRLSGRIPHFSGHFESLRLDYNRFTFDGMEYIAQTFSDFVAAYSPQANIPVHQNGNTLSVSAGGTLSNNTYHWFKCEGTTPLHVATIKGDSVFHPSERGKYRVVVSNSIATRLKLFTNLYDYIPPNKTIVASTENGLQEYSKPNILSVYPNPAKDMLHIQSIGKATFNLIDQSAKTLLTKSVDGNSLMNISNLPAGLYYLKNIQTGEVKKVIISR